MIRPVAANTFRQSVARKGFVQAQGRDHEKYFFHVEGKKTQWMVQLSHSAQELMEHEIRLNAKALGIKGDDLFRILNCEHDAAKTKELFFTVYPPAPRPPTPAEIADEELRVLSQRVEELRQKMEAASDFDEEGLADTAAEWTRLTRELAEKTRRRRG